MNNSDKIVNYLLKNASKLKSEKIEAFGKVIGSLGGEVEKEPNSVPLDLDPNDPTILHDRPVDMSEVTGVKVDNGKEQKIKIYSN